MNGIEFVVVLFALIFLAFCLTAIAIFAISKNKDDVAKHSLSSLEDLRLGSMQKPRSKRDEGEEDTAVSLSNQQSTEND